MATLKARETLEARRVRGRAARSIVPRTQQSAWVREESAPGALERLAAQESIRVPELLPLRYGRMSASPWTYYRGGAAVMAADLASAPHSDLYVQMCGDAHVLNFGLWATPERNLSFALRDFDETLPGPFEWDVKRFVTSLVIIARENGHDDDVGLDAVDTAVRAYRARMTGYGTAEQLEIWYDATHAEDLVQHFRGQYRRNARILIDKKASRRTSQGAFDKIAHVVDGEVRIRENPPFLTHIEAVHTFENVRDVYDRYVETLQEDRRVCLEQFAWADAVRQVVGVGSVGMRVHLILFAGPQGEPLFLQVKQAGPSVYEEFLGPSRYDNHAARVINGQRLIQSATDMFVGWTSANGFDFYVRQFRDMKVIPDTELLRNVLVDFARACGEELAKAHARSGDPVAIAAYIGRGDTFITAMRKFARTYADRNEADHGDLVAAIARGAVPTQPGW